MFSERDEQQITEAITEAEKATSGEIVAVVAAESSTYLYAPFLWASVIALLVPWPLILWTWWPAAWIYLAQVAAFALTLAATLPRPIRYWLVPRRIKHARAHRRAVEQFVVQNLHTTSGRTGVLIFISVAERYAEIVADAAIEARVPKGTWQEIVSRLTAAFGEGRHTEGFVAAIAAVGGHLAKHFPPGSCDANELPDHLIVLDEV
ncbi:TPM domain-containing protein [Hyphomicrobium sp.]|uniref:TPM domain-containing protein n=1 Tax=Hyphomicrobium sp. TaxID=82 RepID=UPI0025C06E0B|nr:TPM domain-containing protein [Hyphomicrobium sp.]